MRWQQDILGQRDALQTLSNVVDNSQQGRFLLFHGPAGVGKSLTAKKLAGKLLCRNEQKPCGQCLGCQTPENHPDAVWLEPEKAGGSIKIDPIRQAQEHVFFPPISAEFRVWMINPMEALTIAAANSVLRILEEPPRALWIIAVSHNLSSIPITLRSRGFKVPFNLLDKNVIATILGDTVNTNAGTVQRAKLLENEQFKKSYSDWQQLITDRWYNPDSVIKFTRSVGGRGAGLRDFLVSILLTYSTNAIAGDIGAPYNGSFSSLGGVQLNAYLSEREILQKAVRDIDGNVNPGFVCEDVIRSIRKIRKESRPK